MSTIAATAFQSALLDWYDIHARALPWRVPPGSARTPDPYRVWLSEIMLQQTVVQTVKSYFETFVSRWPTVHHLAAARDEDVLAAWAGLGYYARARNLIACARAVSGRGAFPGTEAELLELPGIGPYTAAAIASIAFGRPSVVVDGNIERVMARLFAIETPLPAAKTEMKARAADLTPRRRPGDHAQALMDLGATICRPKAAACLACPVRQFCAATGNAPERLPRKLSKAAKPERRGIAYWLTHGEDVLLVRRPDRGLLGGMRALPATPFVADREPIPAPPFETEWKAVSKPVVHVFTHFRLELTIMTADISAMPRPSGDWHPVADIVNAGLPTLFAKAAKLAAGDLLHD
ncbi:A/G-specific adenine glycosylase [Pacificimonas sp. WHA3]|uniref:Adenine DNA glycosylase n=1 Tax=Pacificimonas pallii TaxID=2827236 RepID=A0ABS6SE73_9SPHN|nr:A/G-specific adenine glycosylase [Pacificimonas pallii]MBV7256717.1 A/G-specific adenine glycosylase [Pacificimonas pallii]